MAATGSWTVLLMEVFAHRGFGLTLLHVRSCAGAPSNARAKWNVRELHFIAVFTNKFYPLVQLIEFNYILYGGTQRKTKQTICPPSPGQPSGTPATSYQQTSTLTIFWYRDMDFRSNTLSPFSKWRVGRRWRLRHHDSVMFAISCGKVCTVTGFSPSTSVVPCHNSTSTVYSRGINSAVQSVVKRNTFLSFVLTVFLSSALSFETSLST